VYHGTEALASQAITSVVWRKSMASGDDESACVEVAVLPGQVLVRDSKDVTGPQLSFARPLWQAFVRSPV
jgi:hypothetical protein